jgi:hypothetical protein
MSTFVIGQRLLKMPGLHTEKSLGEDERARKRRMSRRLRGLLKVGIELLIVVWLLGVVWIVPVS